MLGDLPHRARPRGAMRSCRASARTRRRESTSLGRSARRTMSQQGRRWLALALVAAALAPRLVHAADGDGRIALGGVERRYSVHVPASAGAAPPALVIVLHGGGYGRGAAKQTGFSAEADRQGFIAAYPDGSDRARPLVNLAGKPGFLTWNAGACCGYAAAHGIDDVAFLRAVIAQIARDHPIDRRRLGGDQRLRAGAAGGGHAHPRQRRRERAARRRHRPQVAGASALPAGRRLDRAVGARRWLRRRASEAVSG